MTDAELKLQMDVELMKALRSIGRTAAYSFVAKIHAMGLTDEGSLAQSIKPIVKRGTYGTVEGLQFTALRYGFIKAHGIKPQIVETRAGRKYALQGKAPENWIDPVLDKFIPVIAARVGLISGDLVVKSSRNVEFDGAKAKLK